ncbi:lactonase family protein [Hymenobacter aerilatus]|uniref:Lactonase family protein n=1 Tax=Hymenobacter aerilatus TaxID=2932251 RepID=A0A8T9T0Q6_9BACT|nr:lactonase family protein [Hymenobacter aerilatus]UOR06764.1 lactonase family protein [Hymenobacter aerilatus]
MTFTSFSASRRQFLRTAGLGLAGLPFLSCAASLPGSSADEQLLYVGTNVGAEAESLFLYRLNSVTGALTRVRGYRAGANPTYLTLDKKRRYLYAVNETTEYEGQPSGGVSAFALPRRPTEGDLTLLSRQASRGGSPCYISLDAPEKLALVANYVGGNVAALPVQTNGGLGPATLFDQHQGKGPHPNQTTPHAHCFLPDPTGRFAFSVDLGTDTVYGYSLADARQGQLRPTVAFRTKPGTGPRHLIFTPDGRRAYLISELNSTMTALDYNAAQGTFQEIEVVSTLPADFTGESYCADLHLSPDGRFLYGSNRGHNSIVVFAVNQGTGRLTLVQHTSVLGNWPRQFTLTPDGRMLLVANQRSNNIVSFRIDQSTGRLTPTGQSAEVPTPMCLVMR